MEIYCKILNKNSINEIDNILEESYKNHDKLIFIFDLTEYENKINLRLLLKLKPVIEKHENEGEKKIEKIYIIIPKKGPKKIINFFLKMIKAEKPIEILESWPKNQ